MLLFQQNMTSIPQNNHTMKHIIVLSEENQFHDVHLLMMALYKNFKVLETICRKIYIGNYWQNKI